MNYSHTLLFVCEVHFKKVRYQNIITAHAQSIHVWIEFTRRNTFKHTDSHGIYQYIFSWLVAKARKGSAGPDCQNSGS